MVAAVILEDVFLKKYYLIIAPTTKLIVAQNCTTRGFYYSGIISLLKGTIYSIEQKLLFLKIWLKKVSIYYTGFRIS